MPPETLPVVLTAIRALARPEMNLRGVNATTHPVAPMENYYTWLQPHAHKLDVWRATYLQPLASPPGAEHPVVQPCDRRKVRLGHRTHAAAPGAPRRGGGHARVAVSGERHGA